MSPEPDVKVWDLQDGSVIIVASDGLWDMVMPQEAVDLVARFHEPVSYRISALFFINPRFKIA